MLYIIQDLIACKKYALVTILNYFLILNIKYVLIILNSRFSVEMEVRYSTLTKYRANPQISFEQLNSNLLLSKPFLELLTSRSTKLIYFSELLHFSGLSKVGGVEDVTGKKIPEVCIFKRLVCLNIDSP